MDGERCRIRVALIGEHPMLYQPLAFWLTRERGIEASFFVGRQACAIPECLAFAPDVVLVDQQSGNGVLALMVSRLRAGMPATTFLLLADHSVPEACAATADTGYDGLIRKEASAESLATALLTAHQGSPTRPLDEPAEPATSGRSLRLTVREREVLHLLAGGTSTAAIGQRLHIARNTARAHVQRVIEKLGAHSKLEAVAVARRIGIINT